MLPLEGEYGNRRYFDVGDAQVVAQSLGPLSAAIIPLLVVISFPHSGQLPDSFPVKLYPHIWHPSVSESTLTTR